ncbi:MAG TPA: hypothetical protein VF391_15460 [Dermatophilaceae bacterium]
MSAREMRPPEEAQPEIPAKASNESLAIGTDNSPSLRLVSSFKDAYAVLVIGKVARRHVFFGLPAAQKAVDRAHARGDYAELMLVQIVPVGGVR